MERTHSFAKAISATALILAAGSASAFETFSWTYNGVSNFTNTATLKTGGTGTTAITANLAAFANTGGAGFGNSATNTFETQTLGNFGANNLSVVSDQLHGDGSGPEIVAQSRDG